MEMRVRSVAANVRDAPNSTSSTILASLLFGEPVEAIGGASVGDWVPVRFTSEGQPREGFIKGTLLREPVSAAKEELLRIARGEYRRFDFGNGKENRDPYFRFVGEMWAARGERFDGMDVDQPWSGCFISWCAEKANYADFAFSTGHWRYIKDSIAKAAAGARSPYWGFRLHEHKPALGDLVCQWRSVRVTFDSAQVLPTFKGHCDIVIDVQTNMITAIGGNVATNDGDDETVNVKDYRLDQNGFLKPERNAFAILRNNL